MNVSLPPLIPVEDYEENESKFVASVKWLIARVYHDDQYLLEKLGSGIMRDANGRFQMTDFLLNTLCSGSLYAQAAARIFHDSELAAKSPADVIEVFLHRGYCIQFRSEATNGHARPIESTHLTSTSPFLLAAHIAMIDALITVHINETISVKQVVDTLRCYTTVDSNEIPIDNVDALLLWIRKICLLVRADMERAGIRTTIPVIEDLYDDISDGQCICSLIYWYRTDQMPLTDVILSETPTIKESQYNLLLVKHFCNSNLLFNPFHFEIEDLLYLRDPLQTNVNAFLADLFTLLETNLSRTQSIVYPKKGTIPRTFASRHRVSEDANPSDSLRRTNNHRRSFTRSLHSNQSPSRSIRLSQDIYARPESSQSMDYDNFTNFRQMGRDNESLRSTTPTPLADNTANTSIRLAMEEKRRRYEQQAAELNSANEFDRLEKSKATFFALRKNDERSKTTWNDVIGAKNTQMGDNTDMMSDHQPPSSRLNRALSQPSVVYGNVQHPQGYMTLQNNGTNQLSQSFMQQPYDYYSNQHQQPQGHYASTSQLRNSFSNGMINNAGCMMMPMVHPDYQQQMQFQQAQMPIQPVGSYTPEGYFVPVHPNAMRPGYATMGSTSNMAFNQPNNMDTSMSFQNYPGESVDPVGKLCNNVNSFHLHSNEVESSMEPKLNINPISAWSTPKNDFRAESVASAPITQRRQWQNQTFIMNELDLVNSKDTVPHVTEENTISGKEAMKIKEIASAEFANTIKDTNTSVEDNNANQSEEHKNNNNNGNKTPSTTPQQSFLIADVEPSPNLESIANLRRIAKRDALIAKTLERQQKIESKVDLAEQRNAERRQLELQKKEMALQKKLEKEQQRQRILEEYKRKKKEEELGNSSPTAKSSARGHSQPPFNRTKSQMSEALESKQNTPRLRGQSSVEPGQLISCLGEPTHKLFAKPSTKSNRGLMANALQFSALPGAVNANILKTTLEQMSLSTAKQFLILFRDQKMQYRGFYAWDDVREVAVKLSGVGPVKCTENMMNLMFKYNSGTKAFTQVVAKHISATIDAFAIMDQYWQKPKTATSQPSHTKN